jgi:quinoprotein glucose dehydrogenase
MAAILTGWLLVLAALPLAAGGVALVLRDGSAAYALIGAAMLAAGVLLIMRRAAALAIYGLLLLAVGAWALWEVGTDRWQLVPRLALLACIALWLLTPWVRRGLVRPVGDAAARWPAPRLLLAAALLIATIVALVSMARDPYRIDGALGTSAQQPAGVREGPAPAGADWPVWGGNSYGQRYSALNAITPASIDRLRPAWTFHTGDLKGENDPTETTYQITPLKIGDTLVVCTPHSLLIVLDAASGAERWRFDPLVDVGPGSQHLTCRGVAWHDAGGPADGSAQTCTRRIFLPTIDARLFAIDAATGRPCEGFGSGGMIDLKAQMPHLAPGSLMLTSPPVVAHDRVIVGSSINDNVEVNNPSGVVRAFDVLSGQPVWAWHAATPERTQPLPPGEDYPPGGPNSWSVGSADEALGLIYLPMGSPSPDLLGARRSEGVDRHSSAVVALDIATGALRWSFQIVHRDVWDRDAPSQPVLVDWPRGAERVPAIVIPTKQGDLFVLDRRDGRPLVPVSQQPAPPSPVEGETLAAAQPRSALTLMPPPLQETDMWGATPYDQLWCRLRFRAMRYDGPWTPPTTTASLVYPGNTGVFNWGSVAVDPVRGWLVGSPVRLAFTHRLVPRDEPRANLVSEGREPFNENYGGRFAFDMGPFTSPLGLPCQAPPWGLLTAVDMASGQVVWQRRNGTVRDSLPPWLPLPLPMGVASLGGPLVTAGGVTFFSGTLDQYLRAYDTASGRLLWQGRLPAGGQATPMTYLASGRQMVVVAAGGHGSLGTQVGDAIVAFVLD